MTDLPHVTARGICRVPSRVVAQLAAGFRLLGRPAKHVMTWPRRDVLLFRVVAGLIVTALVLVLFDARAIEAARRLPHWLIALFDVVTDFGKSGWFLWPLGIALIALAATPPRLPKLDRLVVSAIGQRLGFLFLAIALPGLFGAIVKRLIGRARPFVTGVADPYAFSPFAWSAAYASFPSGHTTTAFAAAVAVGMLWPKTRIVMWFYAVVIAVSRVVVTAHHPTDVLAGAVLGMIGALLVQNYYAVRRLVFSVTPNGRPRAMPGPSARRLKQVARALLAD